MESGDAHRRSRFGGTFVLAGTLVGGALFIRLYFLVARVALQGDEIHYAESLWRFLHGRFLAGISDYWSFLYPFVAIPFGWAAGDAETGLRILSTLAGAAAVLPAMALARSLAGDRAALFAGILVAIHPNLVSFSTTAATEPLFTFLFLSALWLLARGFALGRAMAFAGAGALLGLAALVRAEGQVLLVLFAVAALFARGGEKARAGTERGLARVGAKARLSRAALIVAAFVVVSIPYYALLRGATGEWTAGSKAAVNLSSPVIWEETLDRERFVYELNDEGTARRIDGIGRESAAAVFWRERGRIAAMYPSKMGAGLALLPRLFSSPLLPLLVLLGLLARRRPPGRGAAEWTVLAAGIFPFAFYSIFRVELRYLVPYLPIYLVWGGIGCAALYEWLRGCAGARRWIAVGAVALAIATLLPFIPRHRSIVSRSQRVEWRQIGAWIRAEAGPGARLLAPSGCSASYYAGNPEATFIPWTDEAGLLRYARSRGYDLLLVDEAYFRAARPTLAGIVDAPPAADLQLLREFAATGGTPIKLYRILPAK